MAQRSFGSRASTGKKLDVIETYLKMYQTALNTRFDTLYIDAFAGSGEVPLQKLEGGTLFGEDEAQEVIVGSAVRAMSVSPPFSQYVFIDARKACLESLQGKFATSPNLKRAKFAKGDANEQVRKICQDTDWRNKRGVVLLDPFGNQVEWETIEIIAATEALDMWYLFPAGVGVFRQIGSNGRVDPTHEKSLDKIFGTPDWRTAFLKPKEDPDLFDFQESMERNVTPESAAKFMIERLRGVFRGGVLEDMIPLGTLSYPSHYLLFAWGNKAEAARKLAGRLSKAALKATERKHGGPV